MFETKRRAATVGMLAALLTLSGCVHLSGGVAPSTIPLAQDGYTVIGGPVTGTDRVIHLLGILPISSSNDTPSALDDALSKAPGADALVTVTADTHSEYWILWSSTQTTVVGTPVKKTGSAPAK